MVEKYEIRHPIGAGVNWLVFQDDLKLGLGLGSRRLVLDVKCDLLHKIANHGKPGQ